MDPNARGAPARIDDRAEPEQRAQLAREGGATYKSSAGRALIVELMVLVVTALTLAQIVIANSIFSRVGTATLDEILAADRLVITVIVAQLTAWLVAFVAWGAWLSRVVSNVPALGGGWPRSTPDSAFLSSIVPIFNLYWSTSVLRDVLVRLSPIGKARTGLLTAWWIVLLLAVLPLIGLIPSPLFLLRLGYQLVAGLIAALISSVTGSDISAAIVVNIVNGIFLVGAGVLAILLVNHVQQIQEERALIAVPAR